MGSRQGMTLMELVVTLAITGMLAAAGAAAFSSIIAHRRVVNEASLQTERAAALRDMIRTWVTAGTIQTPRGGGPRASVQSGNVQVSFVRAPTNPNVPTGVTPAVTTGDELTFTTTALTPANAPSTRIRLYVDQDDATPESGLTIEYQPSTNAPLERREIDPYIGGMIVEYLDSRTRQWFEATQVATITPMAVRLTFLSWDDSNPDYELPALLQLPFVFRIGNPEQQQGGVR